MVQIFDQRVTRARGRRWLSLKFSTPAGVTGVPWSYYPFSALCPREWNSNRDKKPHEDARRNDELRDNCRKSFKMVKLGVKFNSILDNFDIDANGELSRADYTICMCLNPKDIFFYLSILLDICIKTYLLGKFSKLYFV